jgi:hypothetical protein
LGGDTNLDGSFNSSDLVAVFQRGKYEAGIADDISWSDGDWNGDGQFSTSDPNVPRTAVICRQLNGAAQIDRRTKRAIQSVAIRSSVYDSVAGKHNVGYRTGRCSFQVQLKATGE